VTNRPYTRFDDNSIKLERRPVMDLATLNKRIAEIDAKMKLAVDRAEVACQNVQSVAGTFAASWCAKHVENAVIDRPEITEKLGEELSSLKSELNELGAKIPELAKKHLGGDEYWIHRGDLPAPKDDDTAGPYSTHGNRAPSRLDEALRQLMGYAGALLTEYGYCGGEHRSDWETTGAGLRYAKAYDWPSELKKALKQYDQIYDELAQLSKQREAIGQERPRANAKDLWNKA
jgi:hypothetical protein